MLAAEQCGCIPAAHGHRACKRRTTAKETTSKTRTAAASPPLCAMLWRQCDLRIRGKLNLYINKNSNTMKKIYFTILVLLTANFLFGQETKRCSDYKVSLTKTDVSCFSGNDGRIILTVDAPEIKMFQLISNSDNKIVRDFTSDKVFSFLTSGSYRIVCKDTTNSLCYADITIKQPDELKLNAENIVVTNKPKQDKSDGSISVSLSGGTPPYKLQINKTDKTIDTIFAIGNTPNKIIDNLPTGIYTIIIKDNNDCQTKAIQFELPSIDNFGYFFQQTLKTCKKDAEYKIVLTNGQLPYFVSVSINGTPSSSNPTLNQNEFLVPLTKFGDYVVIIKDKRNIPVLFPFKYEDLDCKLKVRITQPSLPNIDNPNNGKIQIQIHDGVSPYNVKCFDNLTKVILSESKSPNRHQEFPNLKEGNYSISIEDSYGRLFDTIVSINTVFISSDIAKKEFENNEHDLLGQLYICECNKDRIESWQKGIRVSIATVGLAGTIASAGVGTLIGGIVSGVVTTGGMLTNEYAPDKKIDILKSNFLKLKEIETLFNKYPLTNFEQVNWNTQEVLEYEALKKRIADEASQLNKEFTATCKEEKLKEKYGWERTSH